jgi:hypothetical protein
LARIRKERDYWRLPTGLLRYVRVSNIKTNSVEDPESILFNEYGSEKVKVAPKNDERKSIFSYSKSCMTILSGELEASSGT